MSEPTKVIVIGAGWSGLVAARTYLHICQLLDRPLDLTILDESADPGGIWSTARLYPGLLANSPNGLYEFSHMTMVDDEHPWYQLVPGERVQSYLEAYSRKFDIYSKIRFNTKVVTARRRGSDISFGWIIETNSGDVLHCDKLVVAAGLYSKPHLPPIPSSTYAGVSIHSRHLGTRYGELRADPAIKNIVVVGGCKSAVEACNVFLPTLNPNHRQRISWIIRPSEKGVPLVVQDVDKAPNIIAANNTRLFAAISPTVYNPTGFAYRFLHSGKTFLGQLLLSQIWSLMSWAIKKDAKYQSSENGRKILPEGTSLFYDINSISLLPKQSAFLKWLHADDESVLKVHRVTPVKLQDRQMVVMSADGTTSTIPCDAVVWCTGWLPSTDFFSEHDARDLGLPMQLPTDIPISNPMQQADQTALANPKPASTYLSHLSPAAQAAEQHILTLFPALHNPVRPAYPLSHTSYRLYRQILPLSSIPTDAQHPFDRTLAFAGLVSNSQTAICSELTSLWAVAYLEDLLPSSAVPSRPHAEHTVDLAQAFMRRRYGIKGARDPEIVLEVQSFLDVLCRDLRVDVWRKKRNHVRKQHGIGAVRHGVLGRWWDDLVAWFWEYVSPYTAGDYEGIVEEFLEANGYLSQSRR